MFKPRGKRHFCISLLEDGLKVKAKQMEQTKDYLCMGVCVYVLHMRVHTNIHVQLCLCACITNQQNLSRFSQSHSERFGPERMAQLKTVVTDDISRDQTESVLPPPHHIPQYVWRAQEEYLHGSISFHYKPPDPQTLIQPCFQLPSPLKVHSVTHHNHLLCMWRVKYPESQLKTHTMKTYQTTTTSLTTWCVSAGRWMCLSRHEIQIPFC